MILKYIKLSISTRHYNRRWIVVCHFKSDRIADKTTSVGVMLWWFKFQRLTECWTGWFSFKKMHFKMSSAKCHPFCLGLNVLKIWMKTYIRGPFYEYALYSISAGISDRTHYKVWMELYIHSQRVNISWHTLAQSPGWRNATLPPPIPHSHIYVDLLLQ